MTRYARCAWRRTSRLWRILHWRGCIWPRDPQSLGLAGLRRHERRSAPDWRDLWTQPKRGRGRRQQGLRPTSARSLDVTSGAVTATAAAPISAPPAARRVLVTAVPMRTTYDGPTGAGARRAGWAPSSGDQTAKTSCQRSEGDPCPSTGTSGDTSASRLIPWGLLPERSCRPTVTFGHGIDRPPPHVGGVDRLKESGRVRPRGDRLSSRVRTHAASAPPLLAVLTDVLRRRGGAGGDAHRADLRSPTRRPSR